MQNVSIYQINTRAFCYKQNKALLQIPLEYFRKLKSLGIDYVWMMGVWEPLSKKYIDKYCKEINLLKEYKKALPDVKEDDIVGSPYAISDYKLNPALGNLDDIKLLKQKLNSIGLKLIVDFVPNHFGASTPLLETHEDVFLKCKKEDFFNDRITFFRPFKEKEVFFAHGKDPNFAAWQDTVQINYFSESARNFMEQILLNLSSVADGVRCDMAMLCLNRIFAKTWKNIIEKQNLHAPQNEFWSEAIKKVKAKNPNFIFIAETYWDTEWEMQNLGFDYTYDKRLMDRIKYSDANDIRGHLRAETLYQEKLVRFIENHDEERSIKALGEDKAKMAAIIISTILGMRFYYDGEFEGKTVKLPVQLRREPVEEENKEIKEFYLKLLNIVNTDIFRKGSWSLLNVERGEDSLSYNNILAWSREYEGKKVLIIINFSEYDSSAHIRVNFGNSEKIKFTDLLNNKEYEYKKSDLDTNGLFVKLKKYSAHIFSCEYCVTI